MFGNKKNIFVVGVCICVAALSAIYVAKQAVSHSNSNECVLEETSPFIFIDPPESFSSKFEVAGCYCEHEGKLLYMLRNPQKPEGNTWCVPGGKLETGETAIDAVVREVKEETGISLSEKSLVYCQKVYVRLPQKDFVLHLFKARLDEVPEKFNIALDEHIAFRWVTCKQAFEMSLIPGGKDCLRFICSR